MTLLPIGSIVLLKKGRKRLMIYGITPIDQEVGKMYDYIGCLYPEGHIGEEYTYLFDHDSIETIDFLGYMDSEYQVFRSKVEIELEKLEGDSNATNSHR